VHYLFFGIKFSGYYSHIHGTCDLSILLKLKILVAQSRQNTDSQL
jgi:hypothetical protein